MSAKSDAILAKYGVTRSGEIQKVEQVAGTKGSKKSASDLILEKYGVTRSADTQPKVLETKMPETQIASPAVKKPDINQLMQQRQQAQVDLDVGTMNQIDRQLKELRAAEGKQTLADRMGDTTGAVAAGYLGDVSSALGTVAESLGAKSFAQKAKNLADIAGKDTERFTQNAKEGLGTMGKFAVDAGIMGGQMAIDAAAGMLVPFGGMAATGTRVFGGGAKTARDAGATQGQQMAYGALTAAASLLTEKISNVSGIFKGTYGKGLLDKALEKLAAKPGGKVLMSALSEGGEEILENAVQPLLQRLTYDPEAAYDGEWLAETLYSGALGAVLGGFGGGVDVVTGKGKTTPEAAKTANAEERTPLNLEGMTREKRKLEMPTMGDKNTVFAEGMNFGQYAETEMQPKFSYIDAKDTQAQDLAMAKAFDKVLKEKRSVEISKEIIKKYNAVNNDPAVKLKDAVKEFYDKHLKGEKVTVNLNGGILNIMFENDGKKKSVGWRMKPDKAATFERLLELTNSAEYAYSSENNDANEATSIPRFHYFVADAVIDGQHIPVKIHVRDINTGAGKNETHYYYHNLQNKRRPDSPGAGGQAANVNGNAYGSSKGATAPNANVPQGQQAVKDPYDIIPKLDGGQFAQGQSFRELQQKQQEETENAEQIVMNGEKDPYDIIPKLTATTIPVKAQESLKRTENALLRRIGKALSVPVGVQRSDLKDLVRSISNEYLRDGKVSQRSMDMLFEDAYKRGIEIDTEYYHHREELKNILRTTAVSISEKDRSKLVGGYNNFRKAAMGTLRISNDGTPVGEVYSQLSKQEPTLFPRQIINPEEQLQRMFEVGKKLRKVEKTLDDYHGEDAATFKAFAKREFNDAVNGALAELGNVRRFSEEAARKQAAKMASTPEQVKAAYDNIRTARKKRERAVGKNLLTDSDNNQVSRLLKGEIELKDLDPKKNNVRGIREVYEAKLEYEQLARVIREYKKNHSQQLRDEAEVLLKNSVNWKDKKVGWMYSRETMERNIRDIVPDREVADRIIRTYFAPVHASNAAAIRAKNDYRNRVKKLGLSRKVSEGNEVSEAYAVQLLGEAEDNIRMLENSKEKNPKRDGQTLQEWRLAVEKLKHNNPNMNWEKVNRAVNEFRAIYDELFQKMNEVRLKNGYEPVAYRQGYFPHFQKGKTGLLASFGAALGINADVTDLPTSINGMTHTFKPGITWFGHAQERKGFNTEYDAVQGFDKYIEGAADVIYQTDNIQRLRALASQIRYRAGDQGLQEQIDKIKANEDLTEDQKQAAISETDKEGGFALSNFVVELEEYTNLLANKKSRADRNMEQALGRRMYKIIKGLEKRVAANMVAVNPGSWLTNFIPITQGMASLNSKSLLKGMWDTIKAYKVDDGMVDMSTFLTNRRGSDPLVRTWAQDWSAKASKPMEWIDSFTADTLVRSRYNQNLSEGLSAAEALEEADAWAAGVMADRSKGATPTLFNRHNPLTKVYTQFQLEVNNQMSYLFKDVPDEMREKGLKALAVALMKMFVGAYLYNEVYEHFIGRRPAMDPLNILNEFAGDLTGYEMDLLDADGKIWEKTEKEGLATAGKNLVGNVAENLPFMSALNLVGINVDSGRIPAASAIPDIANLWDAVTNSEWAPQKRWQEGLKEVSKPLVYLAPPLGGGQIKKAAQGANAVRKGGSYTVNTKGEDILQYPVYTDEDLVANVLRAGLFGKSSLPTAQDWVKSGFDSFSAKETAAYQNAVEAGVGQREANELLRAMGNAQKTDAQSAETVKRKLLQASTISGEGKAAIFYSMMADEKEQALMDNAADQDVAAMAKCLMEIKDANLLTGERALKAKLEAILRSGMSERSKKTVYLEERKGKEDAMEDVLDAGVSLDQWMRFEKDTAGLSSDGQTKKKEKVMAVIDGMSISADQKDALYLAAGYSQNTIDEAPWKKSYDLVANVLKLPKLTDGKLKLTPVNGKQNPFLDIIPKF